MDKDIDKDSREKKKIQHCIYFDGIKLQYLIYNMKKGYKIENGIRIT